MATLTIPSRFNGPTSSGNGGYSCGTLAAHLDGPASVSLLRPVPLDEPLEIRAGEQGAVRALDAAGELVAEAVPAPPLAPWSGPAIDLAAARKASKRYAGPDEGIFAHCFVCGRARPDSFGIFAGALGEDGTVASPWTPPAWAAEEGGAVRPELVWAALDCPAYFAVHGQYATLAFLVRQQAEILAPVRPGVEYVVAARPLERSARKGRAATAILDAEGEVLAHAECLLVAPREATSPE